MRKHLLRVGHRDIITTRIHDHRKGKRKNSLKESRKPTGAVDAWISTNQTIALLTVCRFKSIITRHCCATCHDIAHQ